MRDPSASTKATLSILVVLYLVFKRSCSLLCNGSFVCNLVEMRWLEWEWRLYATELTAPQISLSAGSGIPLLQ
jgi:hypothetical protein